MWALAEGEHSASRFHRFIPRLSVENVVGRGRIGLRVLANEEEYVADMIKIIRDKL
jgi:hypothetical protein